jgi:uncharacterized protein YdaU (DUF1376 family)
MSKRPFMPMFWADFVADTMHLNDALTGNYALLICHYWRHGGLPDDPKQLAYIAKIYPMQWKKRQPILQAFFHDGWRHKRIDEELAKAREYSEKQRSKANAKWLNATKNSHAAAYPDAYAAAMPARAGFHTSLQESSSSEEDGMPRHPQQTNGSQQHSRLDPGVWIQNSDPRFDAWRDYYRHTGQRMPPTGRNGVALFPSEWPPDHEQANHGQQPD